MISVTVEDMKGDEIKINDYVLNVQTRRVAKVVGISVDWRRNEWVARITCDPTHPQSWSRFGQQEKNLVRTDEHGVPLR